MAAEKAITPPEDAASLELVLELLVVTVDAAVLAVFVLVALLCVELPLGAVAAVLLVLVVPLVGVADELAAPAVVVELSAVEVLAVESATLDSPECELTEHPPSKSPMTNVAATKDALNFSDCKMKHPS